MVSPFDDAGSVSPVAAAETRTAIESAAFRRFLAAYPRTVSPTDEARGAFFTAAAPYTDPGVIVGAAEQYAIAWRAGEILDREISSEVYFLTSGQYRAWIPSRPGGAVPPPKRVVAVRVDIGGSTISQEIRAEEENDVFKAVLLLLHGAAPTPASNPERARCRS